MFEVGLSGKVDLMDYELFVYWIGIVPIRVLLGAPSSNIVGAPNIFY